MWKLLGIVHHVPDVQCMLGPIIRHSECRILGRCMLCLCKILHLIQAWPLLLRCPQDFTDGQSRWEGCPRAGLSELICKDQHDDALHQFVHWENNLLDQLGNVEEWIAVVSQQPRQLIFDLHKPRAFLQAVDDQCLHINSRRVLLLQQLDKGPKSNALVTQEMQTCHSPVIEWVEQMEEMIKVLIAIQNVWRHRWWLPSCLRIWRLWSRGQSAFQTLLTHRQCTQAYWLDVHSLLMSGELLRCATDNVCARSFDRCSPEIDGVESWWVHKNTERKAFQNRVAACVVEGPWQAAMPTSMPQLHQDIASL